MLFSKGNVWASLKCHTGDRWQAADMFKDKYGELPEYVTEGCREHVIIAACEVCGGAIFEDEEHDYDSNGVHWHKENCEDKLK